jgi:hypothetical protein
MTNILSSETTIRTVLSAAMLSNYYPQPASSTPPHPETSNPDFSPILAAVRTAVARDPFWRAPPAAPSTRFAKHFLSRSERICANLADLRKQCIELEILVTSPPGSDGAGSVAGSIVSEDSVTSSGSFTRVFSGEGGAQLTRLRPSRLAKRQWAMKDEEVERVAEIVRGWMLDGEEGNLTSSLP